MSPQVVNVIGAGVLGLTNALILRRKGYKVTIIARDHPEDLASTGFASPWAGGFWHSFADDPDGREARWDRVSFHKLWQIAQEDPSVCQVVETYEYFEEEVEDAKLPWFYHDLCPEARRLTLEELKERPGYKDGVVYKVTSWAPARYLPYLRSLASSAGVRFVRRSLSCIDEAFAASPVPSSGPAAIPGPEDIPRADLVVNCSGLGARSLVGVADPAVTPARGQTATVRLPRRLTHCTLRGFDSYIICRPSAETGEPGREAVLGGCYQVGCWDVQSDPELAVRILQDAVRALPALSVDGTLEALDVVSHNVGLRPARIGGPRLESQRLRLLSRSVLAPGGLRATEEREVTVVHCYGISGAGYQASWGMAEDVAELVEAAIGKPQQCL